MPLETVLFDMFDTLLMIQGNHSFHLPAMKRMHEHVREKGISVSFEKFHSTYITVRDKIITETDLTLDEPHFNVRVAGTLKSLGYNYEVSDPVVEGATNIFAEEFMKYVCIDENAEKVLNTLNKKFRLGIISNFAIPECVHKLLNVNGINNLFEVVVISGEVNKRKPSPEIFTITLDKLGVTAEKTAFVGDTADADVDGAKSVGMKSIYIKRRDQKFFKFHPDHIINSLSELPVTLEQY